MSTCTRGHEYDEPEPSSGVDIVRRPCGCPVEIEPSLEQATLTVSWHDDSETEYVVPGSRETLYATLIGFFDNARQEWLVLTTVEGFSCFIRKGVVVYAEIHP